jgi:hypothetical protein
VGRRQGGEMAQTMYAHVINELKKRKYGMKKVIYN